MQINSYNKMMKRLIAYSCMAIFAMGSMAQNQKDEAQMNRFISGLMEKMTLEEKVGQLSQCSGGFATGPDNTRISRTEDISKGLIGSLLNVSGAANTRKYQEAAMKSRLQIPLLFGLDVIHGYRTGFPLPLAEAASFDLDAIERGSRCAAKEAAAAGLHWTFAPMVDISWDARWGRVMEGAGEDPYYGSLVAKARVHGLQGDDLSKENTILSCIKHFAGYGAAIAGKDYNSVDMSMGQFANFYMPPYKAGAEAGAATFMSAFNDFNNEPSTGSTFLLRELLKNQWGFKGFVVSDWGSVGEMMNHRYAKDEKEAAYKGIKAGLDMEMVSECYSKNLVSLVKEGKVSIKLVDDAVRRILEQKYKLGLFDDPFRYCDEERERTVIGSQESRKEACYVSERSIVLLKNEKLLPLSMKKKVIWAGPYTASRELLSRWSIFGEHEAVETIEDILQKKQIEAECITGCNILSDAECKVWQVEQELSDKPRDEQWLETITHEDTVVCVLGEHESQSGEAASRAFLTLPEEQQVLFEKIAERTSNIVTVVITGRPLDLRRISEKSKAVIMAWRPGTMGAEAIVDIVYGRINPSGKLSVSIPWCVGQVPISYWDIKTGHILTEDNSENRFTSRYMDIPNTPLYPFGYGLSYTEFDISDIDVQIGQDKKVHVHCNVCNTGNVAGAEVVQCYYETLYASVVRPKKELVRFRKVFLEPGEKKDVDFFIDQEEFSYYGKNMETVSSGMKLRISIGNSSDHLVSENIIQA